MSYEISMIDSREKENKMYLFFHSFLALWTYIETYKVGSSFNIHLELKLLVWIMFSLQW